MAQWSEIDFVPNAKYWKDWPLARFLQNPLPPMPTSWKRSAMSALFSGETGRYLRRLAVYPADRSDSMHYYRAVFGLAQSKRGFAQVPSSFIAKSMNKHATQLSTPPTSDPDLISAKLFAETFFKGFRCPKIFSALPHIEGSTKACVENSREGGGAREFLRTLTAEYHGLYTTESDVLIRMFNPNGYQVVEERGLPPLTAGDWRVLALSYTPAKSRSYLSPHTHDKIEKLLIEQPDAAGLPYARVASVLEPLKVRLITAMDAVRTHVSRPLQVALWKYLRSSPVFQLIGEPVTEAIIHALIERHRKNGGGEDPFVSGDYSAATDGLDIRLSKVILEVILDNLDPEDQPYREVIASSLLEQVLIYPSWTKIDPVVQKNGQLMGSVLSFPLLCLANLFAYIQSLPNASDILKSRRLMDRLAVLVNGDDILFRSSDIHYENWSREISKVGFNKSVGKNFRHPRFFTVNSIPIEYRPALTPAQFWRGWSWADMDDSTIPWLVSQVPTVLIAGFLNVGLLTGQAKLTGREALGALPLSGWHAGSVLSALNPSQAHKWFLKYHKIEILKQTRFGSTTLNIFAHPLLGGLGFSVPPGIEPRFSPEQRRIAQSLFLSAMYTYTGQESSFKLDSLVFLESDLATPLATLGHLNRRVEVELYPLGTPLPEGYEPFTDQSGIQPLAMVHSPPELEESHGLKARCRLSSNRLRQLTKQFGRDLIDLYPLDKMTEFPFTPVRISRSTFVPAKDSNPNNASLFVERPFSKVYVPDVPHQDIVTPSPDELDIPSSVPQDWEDFDTVLCLVSPPPALERQVASIRDREGSRRRVQEKELRALNRGYIYQMTPQERELFE
jgi:hypothetical protein